jgi:putative membrane-bound dehydrogenase-like protein
MLRLSITLLASVFFVFVQAWGNEKQEDNKNKKKSIKALLVTGGCCHDYERQKLILTQGISARADVEWTIVHQGGSTTNTKIPLYENPDWANGFDVVVHNECFADVKDLEWVETILKPHREGLPAVLIHCSMHCYRTGTDKWFEFTGVQSPNHGPHYGYTVKNLNKNHQIMKGFGDTWEVGKGELYHTVKVWPRAVPLAEAPKKADGQPQVCIWTNEYGKGKVFATTIGHYNETMVDPTYLDTVTKGLLWSVGRTDDNDFRKTNEKTNNEIKALANIAIKIKPEPAKTSQSCCKEGNLAFGKETKASSEEKGKNNFSKNAVDGDASSRWCASSGAKNEWWQVDLGKAEKISNIRIHWEKQDAAYQYKIESSIDQKEWSLVVDNSTNVKKQRIVPHSIKTIEARYLKITCLGANTANWSSIWEFEAYADKMPDLPKDITNNIQNNSPPVNTETTVADIKAPDDFEVSIFGKPPEVNYPVCIATGSKGELFVGVDEQGSLGKEKGRGKILRCVDTDNDGKADKFNTFATVDHPRGLFYDNGSLWVLHPPFLSVFHDDNFDGVSDRHEVLITGISTDQVGKRGADHTTNNIHMGIDGWLYIAVGDFGFSEAKGTDGTILARRGGGVVRVRPDGKEMEIYAWGLRNILDVCIDPFMNIFTRDNTNDGGGWNVRVSHIMQSAEYGYPSLYMNFADEIMPPLGDYGGGSGCGGVYIHDNRWPKPYGNSAFTCDWGRSEVYRHSLTPNGASFNPHQEVFLKIPRPTDADMDASGALYISSWKNGGFNYSGPNVGFITRVIPKGFHPSALQDLKKETVENLVASLNNPSSVQRLKLQREILRRGKNPVTTTKLEALSASKTLAPEVRVAALYTLKQLDGINANQFILSICSDPQMQEYALRVVTDRSKEMFIMADGKQMPLPLDVFANALKSENLKSKAQALISLGRLHKDSLAKEVLLLTKRGSGQNVPKETINHASPDLERVIPHLAVRTLVETNSVQACLDSLGNDYNSGALWALRYMHNDKAVSGLIQKYNSMPSNLVKSEILTTLTRLYFNEGIYKGDWWGTRPDNSGPYYDRQPWDQTNRIGEFLKTTMLSLDDKSKSELAKQLSLHKVPLNEPKLNGSSISKEENQNPIVIPVANPKDPNLIANLNFEVTLKRAMDEKGSPEKGKILFKSYTCSACHTDANGMQPKGPHLVDIGKRYKKNELIESILKPDAKIAQGFETLAFTTKSGKIITGFVVSESAQIILLRQNTGVSLELKKDLIEERTPLKNSMMPAGLVNNLTPEQLSDLLSYLDSLNGSTTKK